MKTKNNIIITLSSQYATMGLIFIATIIIARSYGAKEVGYYALFRLIPNLTSMILGLGLNTAIPYLIGKKRDTPSRIINILLTATIPLSILMSLIWLTASPILNNLFFEDMDRKIIAAACFIPSIMYLNYLFNSAIRGLEKFVIANTAKITGELFSVILLSANLFFNLSERWIVISILGGQAVILMVNTTYLLFRRCWSPSLAWDSKLLRESLSYGLRARIGTIANFLNFRLDILIISILLTPQLVGLYAITSKMAEVLQKISAVLFYVLYPKLARKSAQEGTTLVMRYFGPIFIISAVLGGVCFFLFPWLMVFFYGAESENAVQALRIFIIGAVIFCTNGLFQSFHAGIGKPQFNSYAVLGGLPIVIIGNLILTPIFGLEGAAASSVFSSSIVIFINMYLFLSYSRISFVDLFLNRSYAFDNSSLPEKSKNIATSDS